MRPCHSARRRATPLSRRVVTTVLPNVSMLLLAGCAGGVLDPKGQIGAAESKILLNAFGTMLVVVAPTILSALACAFWFRASNRRARYLPEWSFSGRLELLNWGIPLLVILFLGGLIWIGSHRLDPFRPIDAARAPLEVHVVSLDWKWLFIYPEQSVASVNDLVLPVDTPVHFSLTSATVMNSFFVPQLGGMIATMPGMVTQLHLKGDHIGDLWGLSTQFSGDGYAGMRFAARVRSQAEFERWIEEARKSACDLDEAGYAALLRPSQNVRPFTFRSVAPALFDDIAMRKLTNASGAAPAAHGACTEATR
ncbi:ubiquinol oxidase subunit II [Methylosinus trichosporium OB3b]|uniref:Ubiquinol oxidase subunit 2 n=1 Tax=Methylosinus trichosporium (strain ATCC 35070 / NCIMB 11131 / UNIQEM 75 / OB3b) TaxID=595536 RepID=A0A2D2CXG4_METT3|nr:ubiquinol oxidase subunit II [Methylosinus trichosporium OB3b]